MYKKKILFDSRYENEDTISIPLYVEKNFLKLRKNYLDFLGNSNKKIISHNKNFFKKEYTKLLLETASFNEKSFYRDDNFIFIIKILAIEIIISSNKNTSFNLHYSDSRIKYIINDLKNKIQNINEVKKIHTNFTKFNEKSFLLKFIYNYFIKLKYYIFFKNKFHMTKKKSNILFFSYFINIDNNKIDNSVFYSSQWGNLSNYFDSKNILNNWIHIFAPNNQYKNINEVKRDLLKINKNEKNKHSIIFGYLNILFFVKLIYYFFYNFFFINLSFNNNFNKYYQTKIFKIDLSFLFKRQFYDAFLGGNFVNNYLWIEIFKNFFNKNDNIKYCFYLQENQSWEKILNYYANKNTNLKTIGYIHHIIRNFDLRYFFNDRNNFINYLPNYSLVMGKNCYKKLSKNNLITKNEIVEIEALRYVHLTKYKKKFQFPSSNRILILGGHVKYINNEILFSLKNNLANLNFKFDIKEHPGCPISIPDSLKNDIILVKNPIFDILRYYDAVIVASDSTVAIETFIYGINTLIFLPEYDINTSPLMGIESIKFIHTLRNLTNEIESYNRQDLNSVNNIFNLDTNFNKVDKFLKKINIIK